MKTPLLVSTVVAVATGLAAQGTVVPSMSRTKDPNYYDYMCTYGRTNPTTTSKNEGRGQYIYDSADVGGAAVWKSISWRRSHYHSNTYKPTTFSMTIIMSNSPVKWNAPSTTFKANHGTSTSGTPAQTVLNNAKISLPASTRGPSWPEPWFTPAIPISVFVHAPVKGGSLVIECIGSNNSQNAVYYTEGHRPDTGARVTTVSSCSSHSDGGRNSSISYRFPVIGGQWYVDHGSMPSNEPNMKRSLNVIGVKGPGQTAFGKTLPIPINQLGFLDICNTPSTAGKSRGRLRSPTVNIPNDPKLGGAVFYAQPFCADKKIGNYDQIYMAWGSKWTIGSNMGPMGSTVYRTGDNSQTTGFFRNGYGRTMLLQ
ncbi:MAG: hypothetical protein ACYTGW_18580 [Planctomycetota bacterium]